MHHPAEEVSEERGSRTRTIVLGVVLAAALCGAVYYQFVREDESRIKPVTRSGFDFKVTWKCLACGHEKFQAAGIGPLPCPKCGKEDFYSHIQYACPTHGVTRVAFNYDAKGRPKEIRVPGGQWLPQHNADWTSNARCPKCKAEMNPVEPLVPADAP